MGMSTPEEVDPYITAQVFSNMKNIENIEYKLKLASII